VCSASSSHVPLQRLFEGKWAVTIHCRTCGYVSTQNEPFVVLSVGLVQEHGSVGGSVSSVSTTNTTYASVQQCIDAYLDEHMVPEHVCDKCHIRGTTTHRQRMQSVPSALAVQLKRFQATRGKLAAPVYVDRTIRVHDHEFVLRGVVVHHGPSRDHGHYTAFCRVGADPSPDDSSGSSGSSSGAWVHANDSSIAPANDDALNRACAYLCFYDRVERIDVGA
jgi:ubiquitin C-terminal hydrolase